MRTVTSSAVDDNPPPHRIVTIDHLRLTKRFVTAKPMPRRRPRGAYPLPPIEADASPDALSLREWLVWWLRTAKVSPRDTAIALQLADGESVRAVAPRARVSAQRVQQIGDALARRFDARYQTCGGLALDLGGNRRELLRERGRCTIPAELSRIRRDD